MSTGTPAASARGLVLVGAIVGVTWAAGLRGWMVQMAGPGSSQLHWLGTFGLLLAPGAVTGALLGLAEHRRRTGEARSRWLVLSPCLFLFALADPTGLRLLVTEGIGGGAIGVVLVGLAGGYALSGRGRAWWRRACGGIAAAGLLLMAVLASDTAPLATARGAWVGVYGASLVAVLVLGCAIPQRTGRPLVPTASLAVVVGAVCGIAWAASLRAFMAEVAGTGSGVQWVGTFVWVLLPGAAVGALLARGEHRRWQGGRPHPRWLVWSPMLFAGVVLRDAADLVNGFEGGVGLSAVLLPALCMVGGYAVAGRGARWLRVACGLVFLSAFPIWALTATDVGGPPLSLGTPHGAWAAVLYWGLLATFALGAAIPHLGVRRAGRPPPADHADGPGSITSDAAAATRPDGCARRSRAGSAPRRPG